MAILKSDTTIGGVNILEKLKEFLSKGPKGSFTIPTSGWSSDSTAGYPKYRDISVSGVTASDRASVDIAPASLSAAVACGLCPTTETLAGKIRIRAASVPTAAMTANYWTEKGV